eukprot:CAMPEP_0179004046 /NCGR_PEP_ID=MMETSP0795-20121207/13051_1 /TAXON_ID=88552 /ORGANISM="Amoebophrya sp., Strain Ameob2" /LENGTH=371 /DNA_ID=CAMNT_0020698193 /DNA_START=2008 /DNA_END=3123 /DNA_ORIENTATION=+
MTTTLFVGKKKCGKTTLVERFINPSKEEFPKPTAALDYKFVRQDLQQGKSIAHLYDCGQEPFADLVLRTSTSSPSATLCCVVVLDGTDPSSMLPSFIEWTSMLRTKLKAYNSNVQEAGGGSPSRSAVSAAQGGPPARPPSAGGVTSGTTLFKRPDLALAGVDVEKLVDFHALRPFPVPLMIAVAKYDQMVAKMDAELRKVVIRGLRFFAHTLCAHFVCCAVQEKTAMNNFRGLLRGLLFNSATTVKPCLDMTKALCVPAGTDSLEKIGGPVPGSAAEPSVWQRFLEQELPKRADLGSGQAANKAGPEAAVTNADLAKFPEASIDGMVAQKGDELVQYKRLAERRQRLESEAGTGAGGGHGARGSGKTSRAT